MGGDSSSRHSQLNVQVEIYGEGRGGDMQFCIARDTTVYLVGSMLQGSIESDLIRYYFIANGK